MGFDALGARSSRRERPTGPRACDVSEAGRLMTLNIIRRGAGMDPLGKLPEAPAPDAERTAAEVETAPVAGAAGVIGAEVTIVTEAGELQGEGAPEAPAPGAEVPPILSGPASDFAH